MIAKSYLAEEYAHAYEQIAALESAKGYGCSDMPAPDFDCDGNTRSAWTPTRAEAKAAAYRAQQPRHLAEYTKSAQPSTKARKAARRRAKAGRKASR